MTELVSFIISSTASEKQINKVLQALVLNSELF